MKRITNDEALRLWDSYTECPDFKVVLDIILADKKEMEDKIKELRSINQSEALLNTSLFRANQELEKRLAGCSCGIKL